jgi:hypothetical protein
MLSFMKAIHLSRRPFDRSLPWHQRLTQEERSAWLDASTNCCLYRFYDESDLLLYVGITKNPLTRWEWHASNAAWWPLAEFVALSTYRSRTDCALAEGAAMYHEHPRFNVQYPRPRRGRRSPENPRYAPPTVRPIPGKCHA